MAASRRANPAGSAISMLVGAGGAMRECYLIAMIRLKKG